jgi:Flp pilus assembly protein TadB
MWTAILIETAVSLLGLMVYASALLLIWQVGLPWWRRRQANRSRAQQIDREIDAWLEEQRRKARQTAYDDLQRQLQARRRREP